MKKLLILIALVLLASSVSAEEMCRRTVPLAPCTTVEDVFWLSDIGSAAEEAPSRDYTAINVDLKDNEVVAVTYSQWCRWSENSPCSGDSRNNLDIYPQPNNNFTDQWPGDNVERFWIQIVPPDEINNPNYPGVAGVIDTTKQICDGSGDDADICTHTITADQDGVWQVRFGSGIVWENGDDPLWDWGVTNWQIRVQKSDGTWAEGRVWKDEWNMHDSMRGTPWIRDFYVLARSVDSPDECENMLYDGVNDCKGSLFKAKFEDIKSYYFEIVSNSTGITYNPLSGTKEFIRESIPLQPVGSTCLEDALLIPKGYNYDNTDMVPEHRIYWHEPEFFEQGKKPVIDEPLVFHPSPFGVEGDFTFKTNLDSYYEIMIELDGHDSPNYDPYSSEGKDVLLQGRAVGEEVTSVYWDGYDRSNSQVSGGDYPSILKVYTATANFPLYSFNKTDLKVEKWDDVSGAYNTENVYWYDNIVVDDTHEDYRNLDSAKSTHSWVGCGTSDGGYIRYGTNCFPTDMTVVECRTDEDIAERVYPCCPWEDECVGAEIPGRDCEFTVDTSAINLKKTYGMGDIINTWALAEFDELSGTITVSSVIGIVEIDVSGSFVEGVDPVSGPIRISSPDASRDIVITLSDPITGARILETDLSSDGSIENPQTIPADAATINFNFGSLLPEGAYELEVRVVDNPCQPCSLVKYIAVGPPDITPVPELSDLLVALMAIAAVGIIAFSKKK